MTRNSINRGKQLKFAREYRGYTQSKLCKELKGLSQSNLSKYEKGFEGMLKDKKVEEIIKYLNFPKRFLDVRLPEPYTSWDL